MVKVDAMLGGRLEAIGERYDQLVGDLGGLGMLEVWGATAGYLVLFRELFNFLEKASVPAMLAIAAGVDLAVYGGIQGIKWLCDQHVLVEED